LLVCAKEWRNIKPSNILVDDSGKFYAADRGSFEKLSSEGAFDPPELKSFRDGEAIDFVKANIFSAGMVLIFVMNPRSFDKYISDYEKKNDYKQLELDLRLKSLHHQFLMPLLKRMTEKKPDNRMNIEQFTRAVQG
jgi:serine/threonine protein kinase